MHHIALLLFEQNGYSQRFYLCSRVIICLHSSTFYRSILACMTNFWTHTMPFSVFPLLYVCLNRLFIRNGRCSQKVLTGLGKWVGNFKFLVLVLLLNCLLILQLCINDEFNKTTSTLKFEMNWSHTRILKIKLHWRIKMSSAGLPFLISKMSMFLCNCTCYVLE